MLVVSFKQVKLGVFFDLHAKVVKLLDRSVTCQEILRTRSECDDL